MYLLVLQARTLEKLPLKSFLFCFPRISLLKKASCSLFCHSPSCIRWQLFLKHTKIWDHISGTSESTASCKYPINYQMTDDTGYEIWGLFLFYCMHLIYYRYAGMLQTEQAAPNLQTLLSKVNFIKSVLENLERISWRNFSFPTQAIKFSITETITA